MFFNNLHYIYYIYILHRIRTYVSNKPIIYKKRFLFFTGWETISQSVKRKQRKLKRRNFRETNVRAFRGIERVEKFPADCCGLFRASSLNF